MERIVDVDVDKWTGKDLKSFVDMGLELEKEYESEKEKERVWDFMVFQLKKEWNDRFNLGIKEIVDYKRDLAESRWRAFQWMQVYGRDSMFGRYYEGMKDLD